jgi:hypothetical protein
MKNYILRKLLTIYLSFILIFGVCQGTLIVFSKFLGNILIINFHSLPSLKPGFNPRRISLKFLAIILFIITVIIEQAVALDYIFQPILIIKCVKI